MTNGGTFVINGAERVIISQIVRSPGMYYGHEVDKADQHTYTATVIPVPRRMAGVRDGQRQRILGAHRQEPQAAHHLPDPRSGRADR